MPPENYYLGLILIQLKIQFLLVLASQASSNNDLEEERKKANEERMQLIEEEIVPDIPQNEEDHLDLELEDEAAIYEEYKALLASVLWHWP